LAEILSLKDEDKQRLNPHALSRINDLNESILNKVPLLQHLSTEQVKADLDTYLDAKEQTELDKCLADIKSWLVKCMDTGNGYCPYAYATWVIYPMNRVESLIMRAYQRAESEQQEKELRERRSVAFDAINPPVNDAKRYLNEEEYNDFLLAVSKAIDAYLEKGGGYPGHVKTFEYRWSLEKINDRKEEEEQKVKVRLVASEYNHRLNQEIKKLSSQLSHRPKDLSSYFYATIQDKRLLGPSFDYVLSTEEKDNLDSTLVKIANKRLLQIIPDDLRQFIVLPSQYYRMYFPLPAANYCLEEVPSIEFVFEIFVAAYGAVWLKAGKKNIGGYEVSLPQIEEKDHLVTLQKPKLLGYHYLILRPEDLDGYLFWESIPLILIKGLLKGEIDPEGSNITAASDEEVTYRISEVEDEIIIPNSFAEYLKTVGTIDHMVNMNIMTEKVATIVRSELDKTKIDHEVILPQKRITGVNTKKARLFELFSHAKRPSDPEVKALGIKPETVYRYYQQWKRNHNRN
jgi:hypothetical protein